MKQFFSVAAFSAAALFASCASNNKAEQQEAALRAKQASLDSMKHELAKQRIIDSMQTVAAAAEAAPAESVAVAAVPVNSVAAAPVRRSAGRRTSGRRAAASDYGTYSGSAPASNNRTVVYEPAPAPVQKKRGWSAKAKGAVIGGAAGAASGAVINKRNRAGGAVIGGVLGAAAGTGVGAVIDRKNGR